MHPRPKTSRLLSSANRRQRDYFEVTVLSADTQVRHWGEDLPAVGSAPSWGFCNLALPNGCFPDPSSPWEVLTCPLFLVLHSGFSPALPFRSHSGHPRVKGLMRRLSAGVAMLPGSFGRIRRCFSCHTGERGLPIPCREKPGCCYLLHTAQESPHNKERPSLKCQECPG